MAGCQPRRGGTGVQFPAPLPLFTTPTPQIIVQYEISAPEYHPDRLVLAFVFLDEMISVLELTSIDAGIGDVCRCVHGAAPVITDCVRAAMGPELGRDRDDECRRVRWAALSLATSLCTECLVRSRPDKCTALSICDPANYLVLFPKCDELCKCSRRAQAYASPHVTLEPGAAVQRRPAHVRGKRVKTSTLIILVPICSVTGSLFVVSPPVKGPTSTIVAPYSLETHCLH
ncbi:hypothetical protein B0H14DRAFT_3512321 [Mycena olivaceomarginata]|nr:hypothetical protein B0H14DRAFT_3512321 [Mycena olivaceomarginata]